MRLWFPVALPWNEVVKSSQSEVEGNIPLLSGAEVDFEVSVLCLCFSRCILPWCLFHAVKAVCLMMFLTATNTNSLWRWETGVVFFTSGQVFFFSFFWGGGGGGLGVCFFFWGPFTKLTKPSDWFWKEKAQMKFRNSPNAKIGEAEMWKERCSFRCSKMPLET